jgi:hypothetical protein
MNSANRASHSSPTSLPDDGYETFLAAARAHFVAAIEKSPQLFTTDATGLWELYLDNAPAESRSIRTCSACKKFVTRFGGLVTISNDGSIASAFWPKDPPAAYAATARAISAKIAKAKVSGVFRWSAATLGTPVTGEWTHLAVDLPASLRWANLVTNASQAKAAKAEERAMLLRGLEEFPVAVVRKASALLTAGSLYRSEKCEGVAAWLLDLHERRAAAKNERLRDHLTWLAVGGAPPGFCHVRGGMIGTLLEDIVAELPFSVLKERFDKKMHPLQYLRPQAAPSAENIAQAEKIVATLRSAGALERRFAKLSDVQSLWAPKPLDRAPKKTRGVFGHLAPRAVVEAAMSGAPPTVMTWVKFEAEILPSAEAIEFLVPFGKQSYAALVTAKNADAPPMLQWDREGRRNPVSLYLYVGGSKPETWNLNAGEPRRVTAIVLNPAMWESQRSLKHQGSSVCFLLENARDKSHTAGGGLFVENLKSDYHPVRRTLEAYFKSAVIEGKDEAEACGLFLSKGAKWDAVFRVTSRGIRTDYILDRWD